MIGEIQMIKQKTTFLEIIKDDNLEAFFGQKYVFSKEMSVDSKKQPVLILYCNKNGAPLEHPNVQAIAKYEVTDFTFKQVGVGEDQTHNLGADQSWQAYMLAKHEMVGNKAYGKALVKEYAKESASMDKRFSDLIDGLHENLKKIRKMENDFSKKIVQLQTENTLQKTK